MFTPEELTFLRHVVKHTSLAWVREHNINIPVDNPYDELEWIGDFYDKLMELDPVKMPVRFKLG
jgi:hypothetical protein